MARILVVFEDNLLVNCIKAALCIKEYESDEVFTGDEALNALDLCNYDAVVIMSSCIADMEGGDLCRHIKYRNHDLPVIMVTSVNFDYAGEDVVLPKPLKILHFLCALKFLLQN